MPPYQTPAEMGLLGNAAWPGRVGTQDHPATSMNIPSSGRVPSQALCSSFRVPPTAQSRGAGSRGTLPRLPQGPARSAGAGLAPVPGPSRAPGMLEGLL